MDLAADERARVPAHRVVVLREPAERLAVVGRRVRLPCRRGYEVLGLRRALSGVLKVA